MGPQQAGKQAANCCGFRLLWVWLLLSPQHLLSAA